MSGKDETKKSEVSDIRICKLPYQEHPFVHGVRDGKDVWLMSNGEWTEVDGHEMAVIPLQEKLTIKDENDYTKTSD